MSVTKQQIDAGLDKVWDDIQSTVGPLTVEEFKAMLAKVLFPQPEEEKSDSEGSTASKRGRKKGPMSDDAKAAMVAKRKATMAAKAQAPKEEKPEEPKVAAIAVKMVKPKKVNDKPKMSKEDRSAAAKARWEAKSEEEKEAIKANLAAARAAKKAAKAE
jgi:electron transfer flavoprotein alpha subunit